MYYGKLNVAMLFFSVNLYTQRNNYECCHVLFLCRGINGYPAAQSDSLFKHLNTCALTLKIPASATSMVLNLPYLGRTMVQMPQYDFKVSTNATK